MTSAANRYRKIADRCRRIPAQHGLREHSVALVRSEWTGASIGEGQEVIAETPLTVYGGQNPKVRFPGQKELAMGMMQAGTVMIGPLTPDYEVGGISRASLDGALPLIGVGRHIRVSGPQCPRPTLYRIVNVDNDQALHFMIEAVPAEG